MPRTQRPPSYRLHKPTGQAVVTLDRRDHYLGKHGTAESRAEYDRLIAEWLAGGRSLAGTGSAAGDFTVNELILAYLNHADDYYVKDGMPTTEPANFRLALRPLRALYGPTAAGSFGPRALQVVRQAMVDAGLCRNEVNQRTRRIVRMFRWGVVDERVAPAVHQSLAAVPGLRKGRPGVRESKPVGIVPDATVDATLPFLPPPVRAMVEVQRLTGARPGEVVRLRALDIDRSGEMWVYRPLRHKTEHHDKERTILIGPKAQAILREWSRPELEAPLFCPRAALARRWRGRRQPGAAYTTTTYRRAIARACVKAGVPHWHPHQLRHSAATRLRKEFGIEVARIVLGHSNLKATEVYAEADHALAARAMAKLG